MEITAGEERSRVMKVCVEQEPVLKENQQRHWAACHFVENYQKAPVTKPLLEHRREVVPEAVVGGDKGILVTAKEEYRS
jgi:hypothetical protein